MSLLILGDAAWHLSNAHPCQSKIWLFLVDFKMYDIKFLQTSSWNNLHPHQVIGTAALVKEIDCLTATVDDILKVRSDISSSITLENTRFCGFGGWFDVHFRVSWYLVSVFVMHPRTPNHLQDNIILYFLSFWWCTREGGRTQLRKRLSWQLPQALIMGHIGANRYESLIPLNFNSFLNIWKKKLFDEVGSFRKIGDIFLGVKTKP